jgi:Amt family ammonium transporter
MIRPRLHRLRELDTYKLWATLLAGKLMGLGVVIGAMKGFNLFLNTPAGAAVPGQEVAEEFTRTVNATNTMWVLVAAFLVFFMQAGFMALEAGFARSRETINILMECVFDTCLCGILYWAVGFAFQFGGGAHGGGTPLIGQQYFFLQDIPATYDYSGLFDTHVSFLAFFLFQFAFADTASTITSGAMVGRTSFKGDILYSTCVSGLIYPIFAHWVWGPGGWLATTMGWFSGLTEDGLFFRDFAGSTVVHTVGGTIALAGAITLGPRLGRRFKSEGGGPTPPHDLTIAALGAVILWFGWYGFNPGSTLSGFDFEGIGRVAANTTLAACAGGLVAVLFVYPRSKTWDLGMSLNGFLGGLVAITAPCFWVSPTYAVLIGSIAGIIVPLGVDLLEKVHIDDPIGAVPVHMMCGVFGTLAVGLFGAGHYSLATVDGIPDTSAPVEGLVTGGGAGQLLVQVVGSLSCMVVVFAVSFTLFKVLRKLPGSWNLRLEEDLELEGIDITEHGTPAYHMEFGQGMTYTSPAGLSGSSLPHTFGAGTKKSDDEKVGSSS